MHRAFVAVLFAAFAVAQSKLTVDRLAVHQHEDGPVLPLTYEFLPGETVHFSARLNGFAWEQDKESPDRYVRLTWQTSIADAAGVAVDKPQSGKIQATLTFQDKEWKPKMLANWTLPPHASGGTYRVTLQATDDVSHDRLTAVYEFKVRAPSVEPAPELAVRNLRFLRHEDDTAALNPPAYRGGEALWAKFDIAGYKLGPSNRISVSYGLAVENAEGKQLFAQPDAALEQGEYFYPRRSVPGTLSLTLDANVAAGEYVLVVLVDDKLGGTKRETRAHFRVE